jgi:hypothetical protein
MNSDHFDREFDLEQIIHRISQEDRQLLDRLANEAGTPEGV